MLKKAAERNFRNLHQYLSDIEKEIHLSHLSLDWNNFNLVFCDVVEIKRIKMYYIFSEFVCKTFIPTLMPIFCIF